MLRYYEPKAIIKPPKGYCIRSPEDKTKNSIIVYDFCPVCGKEIKRMENLQDYESELIRSGSNEHT